MHRNHWGKKTVVHEGQEDKEFVVVLLKLLKKCLGLEVLTKVDRVIGNAHFF